MRLETSLLNFYCSFFKKEDIMYFEQFLSSILVDKNKDKESEVKNKAMKFHRFKCNFQSKRNSIHLLGCLLLFILEDFIDGDFSHGGDFPFMNPFPATIRDNGGYILWRFSLNKEIILESFSLT